MLGEACGKVKDKKTRGRSPGSFTPLNQSERGLEIDPPVKAVVFLLATVGTVYAANGLVARVADQDFRGKRLPACF